VLFRHSEDRLPVLIFSSMAAVDVAAYLLVDSLWLLIPYFVLMIIPKGICSAWNHHHQHAPTFRSAPLNRLLEFIYGLHTGMPTNMWVLHHVLGHHVNYLDQSKDESGWTRKDGTQMGELEYTVHIALTAYPRALAVGKRYPRIRRDFLIFGGLAWATAGLLVWARPAQGLLLYVLPMITTIFYTSWVTYDHHAGLRATEHIAGSYNILNDWFNRLSGNLGFHTAHHWRPGVHWSRLPALHERIKDGIPAHCYTKTLFDAVLPNPPSDEQDHRDAPAAPMQSPDLEAH